MRMPTTHVPTTRVPTKHVPTTRCALLLLLACGVALRGVPATSQTLLTTIPTGSHPVALAPNPASRKLYVANQYSNNVTVIDEVTYATATIPVGSYPTDIAANPVTNKVYVANQSSNTATVIDGVSGSTSTVATRRSPVALAINSVTNQIYVANYHDNSVTAINGSNNSTVTIAVGNYPTAVALNSSTNKIYVANLNSDTVTVIDGATRNTATIAVGSFPKAVAVNPLTNKIYVANGTYLTGSTGTVTVIDGATKSTTVVPAGTLSQRAGGRSGDQPNLRGQCGRRNGDRHRRRHPFHRDHPGGQLSGSGGGRRVYRQYLCHQRLRNGSLTTIDGATGSTTTVAVFGIDSYAVAVDAASHRVYTANLTGNTVAVIAGAWSRRLPCNSFLPLPAGWWTPVNPTGNLAGRRSAAATSRDFSVPDNVGCGIPATAAAYSLNVAVVPHGGLGYLTMWPTGQDQPVVSTLNSLDGRIKANAAIVPAGANGAIRIFASNTTDVVLDIDGYFLAAPDPSAYAFFPLTPCRVADTRTTKGPLGGPYLYGGQQRDFPVLAATSCGIPNSAIAYSLNFAAIPRRGAPLGYLTVWPTGQSQPLVSTLNALTGTVTANAAIVPAGQDGEISLYASNDTDLVIDINGYFAPAGPGGLSLYATAPCRVLDTRKSSGAFYGELTVNVVGSPCGVPATAQAYVFNAAVVPQGALGYLTLWPDGQPRPLASTLNALDGAITSNMAIVPTSNGYIDAYASGLTQLVLDISSYFAP